MKILVLGSNGMAGHVMTKYFYNKGYSVRTLAKSNADYNIDIENQQQVIDFFTHFPKSFEYVINCIGLLVKDSIERPDRASIINSWFPHYVEMILKNTNTKLVHLSTDCVFNGSKGNYIETDIHDETNFYGKSKSLGEVNNNKDITFRMSIIGPEIKQNGTGLLNWILKNKETELPGWENALWNGMTTLQLAKCIEKYMLNSKISGVYNLVSNKNSINKFELLSLINKVYRLNKTIKHTLGPKNINKILVDTRKEINFEIPDYLTMLEEMRDFV